jgi:uncharacterized protein YndB with AHSA1/START domain
MPREFELNTEITVDATPEEVWDAITTGPGVDSWFMGRADLEPGEGGTVRFDLGVYAMESKITTWDPPHRFEHRAEVEPDGTFRAFEFMIEGREHGSTVVRAVLSGFLGGDNWETEYNALSEDGPIYTHTLGEYLTHFRGRTAQPITGFGSRVIDRETYWSRLRTSLGLGADVTVGDDVHLAPEGLPPIDGVVDYLSPTQLGVRSTDGLFRWVHGLFGTVVLGHHLFDQQIDEQPDAERAWTIWLDRTFA